MPFRDRVRRVLGKNEGEQRKNSNTWANMPPMKYRRAVDPAHKDRLNAFSFSNAWRRKSTQSGDYSPMQSRQNSNAGRRSTQTSRKGVTGVEKVDEGPNDEADVANVGKSRKNTNDDAARHQSDDIDPKAQLGKPEIKLNDNQPFTQQDLDLALKKSNVTA